MPKPRQSHFIKGYVKVFTYVNFFFFPISKFKRKAENKTVLKDSLTRGKEKK